MKNWRPRDWAITKRKYCDERLKEVGGAVCETCPAEPQTCNVNYEAGADAMLEAIKKLGEYAEYEKPTIIRGMTENNKGWIVFIPDEETKDERS